MLQLPPRPDAIRTLSKDESDRLEQKFPGLPKTLAQCPTCYGEKKFRWYADYGNSEEIADWECPCADQFLMFKYFLNSGVGKLGQTMQVNDVESIDDAAMEIVVDYVEHAKYYVNRGMGLLFHGNKGTGKTFLTMLLIKQLLAVAGIDGYFITFNQFLDNFTAGWRDDANRKWFDLRIRNAPFLVVDDIGKENQGRNSIAAEAIDSVFRTRNQSQLPTIITTNLSLHDFERSYSSGVMSILSETSITHEFTGADWREHAGDRNRKEAKLMLTRPIVVK